MVSECAGERELCGSTGARRSVESVSILVGAEYRAGELEGKQNWNLYSLACPDAKTYSESERLSGAHA